MLREIIELVPAQRQQDKPSHRERRRFSRTHERTYFKPDGIEIRQRQLSSYARYGTERSRCDWFGSGCGCTSRLPELNKEQIGNNHKTARNPFQTTEGIFCCMPQKAFFDALLSHFWGYCFSDTYNAQKYKALILKYKALILKYMPCIFHDKPCVFFGHHKTFFARTLLTNK